MLPPLIRRVRAIEGGLVVIWQPEVTAAQAINAWLDGGDELEAAVMQAAGIDPTRWTVYDSKLMQPPADGGIRERLYLERR